MVAARSRDFAEELPFGTIIKLSGPAEAGRNCGYDFAEPLIGYRVIADTMNARMHDHIDVLFDTDTTVHFGSRALNPANALGACEGVTVTVVGFVDISRPSKLPKTQAELAALIEGVSADFAVR